MKKQKLWADTRETKRELLIKFNISEEFYTQKHTKWKNLNKGYLWQSWNEHNESVKISNLNQIGNGTKLSTLYPHSQCNTSDLKILKEEIDINDLKEERINVKFSYLQMT